MANPDRQIPPEAIWRTVRTADIGCATPTLLILLGAEDTLTAHREPLPDDATEPDTIGPALTALAGQRLTGLGLQPAEVVGYAVILPHERVAFAVDRTRTGHSIQLAGTPLLPPRPDRWGPIQDTLRTLAAPDHPSP